MSTTTAPSGSPQNRVAAFTLIEILVAMAVLVLLVLLIAHLMQSGNMMMTGSRKRLSADAQAREVFSRFDLDLRRMPIRPDIDVILSAKNDVIYFYSEAQGFYPSTNVTDRGGLSLIGYRVNKAQLERLGKGLSWSNSNCLTYSATPATNSVPIPASTIDGAWSSSVGSAPAYANGTDDDFHVVADGVFRLFYCFRKKDGTYALTLNADPIKGKLADAAALVLTLAVLENDSRKVIADTSKLASALPDPTQSDLDSGLLPEQRWQAAVNDVATFATAAAIPVTAAGRVRIYQRSFSLDAR